MIENLRPGPGCGVLVGLIAQWVDAGFDGFALLERLLARFPKTGRPDLPLLDYLHLRMAEGALAMSHEDFDRAICHFGVVQSLEDETGDPELSAIANFWTARCLRKTGRYDDALKYTEQGEALALACGYVPDGRHHASHAKLAGIPEGKSCRRPSPCFAAPTMRCATPTTS